jgi:hypothetical protein
MMLSLEVADAIVNDALVVGRKNNMVGTVNCISRIFYYSIHIYGINISN